MNLKNYTTEVPASRSIEAIEKLLVYFGSTNIMKVYGPAGKVSAISFIVEMDGMKLHSGFLRRLRRLMYG